MIPITVNIQLILVVLTGKCFQLHIYGISRVCCYIYEIVGRWCTSMLRYSGFLLWRYSPRLCEFAGKAGGSWGLVSHAAWRLYCHKVTLIGHITHSTHMLVTRAWPALNSNFYKVQFSLQLSSSTPYDRPLSQQTHRELYSFPSAVGKVPGDLDEAWSPRCPNGLVALAGPRKAALAKHESTGCS